MIIGCKSTQTGCYRILMNIIQLLHENILISPCNTEGIALLCLVFSIVVFYWVKIRWISFAGE